MPQPPERNLADVASGFRDQADLDASVLHRRPGFVGLAQQHLVVGALPKASLLPRVRVASCQPLPIRSAISARNAEVVARDCEGFFCLRVLKIKARADIRGIDPPIDPVSFRYTRRLSAQKIQLPSCCADDQAISLRHECCPQWQNRSFPQNMK
jgi:hypothetical protein